MERIRMTEPLVELDGDEMTRVIWKLVKDDLILPYVELKTEYYDLGLTSRNDSLDKVTVSAADAIKRLGVGVKCATITPNRDRLSEYPELKELWKSPNGTLRAMLDGTVFRTPIIVRNIKPAVPAWTKPITIARHAYGDIYGAAEYRAKEGGTAALRFEGAGGDITELSARHVDGPGVYMLMHNTDASIESFMRSCFRYALGTRQDLWFSAKDTILNEYDGAFKRAFERERERNRAALEECGIECFYTLIDDAVSRVMRSGGGFIWALKNYDGDVMSDMVSSAFGSLAMMTSVLVSPDGKYEYEAAHGTVTKHYVRHKRGEETSTNPTATIFAWTGALRKRGELDCLPELVSFAGNLERAAIEVIENGSMTGDLAAIAVGGVRRLSTREFIREIGKRLASGK